MEWSGGSFLMKKSFETVAEYRNRLENLDQEAALSDLEKMTVREKLAELNVRLYPDFEF